MTFILNPAYHLQAKKVSERLSEVVKWMMLMFHPLLDSYTPTLLPKYSEAIGALWDAIYESMERMREAGEQFGERKQALQIAERMLATGYDIETVGSLTQLPIKEVQKIARVIQMLH